MIEFRKQRYGAEVATLLEDDEQAVEVLRRADGDFELTVHIRRGKNPDAWDDLTAVLKPEHFIDLGKIADMTLCREQDCPSFGQPPGRSCKCHPRYGRTFG